MRALIRRTWFATSVFAVTAFVASLQLASPPGTCMRSAATAIVVTPLLWAGLVVRRSAAKPGRGAAAGALAAVITWLMSLILIEVGWRLAHLRHRDALGDGTGGMILFFVGLAGIPVAGATGALLGALTAWAQGRWRALGSDGERRKGGALGAQRPQGQGLRWFVRETWLAALMFLAPEIALALARKHRTPDDIVPLLAVALIAPPVWWWMVARHREIGPGRGAMAGLVVATANAPVEIGLYLRDPAASRDVFTVLMVLGFIWIITVPCGAAIGALTAILHGRLRRKAFPQNL